jgi:hypothetical protein
MDILLSHFFCHSRKYFYIRDSMRQGSITYGISYRPATPNIFRADVAGGPIKSLSCAVIEPTIFFETLPSDFAIGERKTKVGYGQNTKMQGGITVFYDGRRGRKQPDASSVEVAFVVTPSAPLVEGGGIKLPEAVGSHLQPGPQDRHGDILG